MRPKITSCKSVARSLRYNEQKVDRGTAECLTAANFLKDRERLTVEEKLHCFERRMQLNERVSTNLHITLNFDPRDNLSNERMRQIAKMYMDDIGFGRQPYLVYRHHDAGHPHCHIVSTHIRSDGSPIDLYNIGRRESLNAGNLSVYLLRRSGRTGLFLLVFHTILGRLRQMDDFEEFKTRSLTIETKRKRILVAIDGEVSVLESPLEYRIHAGKLKVIAPAKNS